MSEPHRVSRGGIPLEAWNALLQSGLDPLRAYRLWQVAEGYMKNVSIYDFLTEEQIAECERLYPDVKAINKQVIAPNIDAINRKLGQENDPTFLAYAVHYVISQAVAEAPN